MKNLFKAVAVIAMLTGFAFAQQNQTTPVTAYESYGQGTYNAQSYNYSMRVLGGGAAAGATYSVQVSPSITLADGRRVNIFANSVLPPITIGQGSTQETVTPSSVTGCNLGVNAPVGTSNCLVTATFSNAHGAADLITSGDSGWQEAVNDAANNGGGTVFWSIDCGIVTLSTGGATTTTTCLVPKTLITQGASVKVSTAVTTAASYSLGISGHTTTFMTSCTAVALGADCSQFIPSPTTLAAGAGTSALLVTANATPGAGAVHIRVWGETMAQSAY